MRRLILLCVAVLMFCGASLAADPAEVLLQADRDFCKDVNARHVEGFMAWMAPNVVTFGGSSLKGLDEVRKSWTEAFADPDFHLMWEPSKAEMFPSGTMGYTVGRFTMRDKGTAGPTVTKGSYLTVWQKQKDGSWKVLADGGAQDGGE